MRVVFALALVLAVAGCGQGIELSPDPAEADHGLTGLDKTTFMAKWTCGAHLVGGGCIDDGHNYRWSTSDPTHTKLEGCQNATCVVTCLGTADDIQISASADGQVGTASLSCK
jgi:hypothetical protein